jgi:hypothetical protein
MHNIESYSKYLHQLVKEGKYENVLINFRENSSNFTKEEVGNNGYLIADLLRSFKEQGNPLGGLNFLKNYEIDVFKKRDIFLIGLCGWLLHAILKSPEDHAEILSGIVNDAKDFLGKISFLEESNRVLITQLFLRVISYEKKQKPLKVDGLLDLLKKINIKHDKVKNVIASEPYVVAGILDIFRKSNHVERAFGFLKFLSIEINSNTSEQILNSYGWCLYAKLKIEINDEDDDDSDTPFDSLLVDLDVGAEQETGGTLDLHPTNDTLNLISNYIGLFSFASAYSPFSRLFNLSLKAEKQKTNPNWIWMEQFLFPFKGKDLSKKSDSIEIIRGGRPKTVELASDFETWYSYYSLSLLKQKKFQDCIDVVKEALFSIEKFHYNNDLWFARKIALSNKGLGNISQAINEMEEIERRKAEWFIQKELAELYFEGQQNDKAKSIACKGALAHGDKEKKDGLFFLLGQIFRASGEQALAHKHFLLVNLIRNEQGWFVPNRLKIALEETFSEGIKYDDSVILYKELLIVWRANIVKEQILEQDSGRITKVNPQKQIGEIVGKGGGKYFFHFNDFKDNRERIQFNAHVIFAVKEPKGDRPGMNLVACNIKLRPNF